MRPVEVLDPLALRFPSPAVPHLGSGRARLRRITLRSPDSTGLAEGYSSPGRSTGNVPLGSSNPNSTSARACMEAGARP
jgi:hypothetical protein